MEGRCKNCNRLIYDTEKLDELPNMIECQHCHHVNIIRRKAPRVKAKKKIKPASKPIEPTPGTEELAPEAEDLAMADESPEPEAEDLSAAASPTFQAAMRDESPETEETAEEG